MREVSAGDVVFAFVDTFVVANGVAQSYCWESPKPTEFGTASQYWEDVGWKVKVKVHFILLNRRVRPKDHIDLLRPLLPSKYSPLQANQPHPVGVPDRLPGPLAEMLAGLNSTEAQARSAPLQLARRCRPTTA